MFVRGKLKIGPAVAAAATLGTSLLLTGCSGGQSSVGASGAASSTSAAGSPSATTSSSASASASASSSAPARAAGTRPVAAPPPASARAVADDDTTGSGVVRVQVATCQGMASAAGSFVADDLVVTTDAVTKGLAAVAVHSSSGVVRGQVVAQDAQHDLAVVKLLPTGDGSRLTGHVFSTATPASGEKVTMYGFPVGRHLYRDAGTLTGSGSAFTTTANAAPGTTGGAMLDSAGRLVGVQTGAATGQQQVAGASTVSALVQRARTEPSAPKAVSCPVDGASLTSIHPDAPAIRVALAQYVLGLENPDQPAQGGGTGLQQAWATLTDARQRSYGTPAAFEKSFAGARPSVANVDNLERTGWSTDTLLWTIQMEGPGKACAVHSQKVVLDSASGTWQVADVTDTAAPRSC